MLNSVSSENYVPECACTKGLFLMQFKPISSAFANVKSKVIAVTTVISFIVFSFYKI